MCTCIDCGKSIVSGKKCKFCKCFRSTTTTVSEDKSMELLVPKSLIIAMNRESMVELNAEDIKNNLVGVIKMISAYESKHNYVPGEWSAFLDNLSNVLGTLTGIQTKEMASTTLELEAKRAQWISKLVFSNEGTETELRMLSMVELRDRFEEVFPSYITVKSATATGGSKVLVTKISKAA